MSKSNFMLLADPHSAAGIQQSPGTRSLAPAKLILAGGFLVAALGVIEALRADDLSPEVAGRVAASAQFVAHIADDAWRNGDRMLGPLIGTHGRAQLAATVGQFQQAMGAASEARRAWQRAEQLARRMDDDALGLQALTQGTTLALVQGDYATANDHALRMLERARRSADSAAQANAEGFLGVIARRRGELEEARRHQETALALRRSLADASGEAQVLSNLGTVYRDLGDFARALDLQLEALDIRKRLGGSERLDLSYRNIALLYREIEDTEQAKANFRAALTAAQATHDPQALATVLGSYASFSNDIGDAASAQAMARQALAIDSSVGNRPYVGLEQLEIGRSLSTLKKDNEAEAELQHALAIGRELAHREIIGGALLQLGRLAIRAGDDKRARTYIDESLAVLAEAKLKPQLAEAYAAREELAQADGDLAQANGFAHQRSALREELLGARSGRQLATLKSRYERADAEQRIKLLRLDNEVQGLRLRQQALLRNLGLGVTFALIALLLLLLWRYRTSRRLNTALQLKNAEISAHELALTDANAKLSSHAADLFQAAITDPLTGCYNRGHLMRQLDENIRHSDRARRDLSVLLIDFDHFKQINDQHGHLFGDRVLASGVQIMRQWIEPGDLLGRYGGEEFVAVLPDRDADAAAQIAERLRDKVAQALNGMVAANRPLTISIGVASLDQCSERSLETLLGAADIAVYQAKAMGRNRVVCYDPNNPLPFREISKNHG
ncbi:MAG: tetratricopeptide repeat-containing diguanylate cyclase [Tahibacter sp.]